MLNDLISPSKQMNTANRLYIHSIDIEENYQCQCSVSEVFSNIILLTQLGYLLQSR